MCKGLNKLTSFVEKEFNKWKAITSKQQNTVLRFIWLHLNKVSWERVGIAASFNHEIPIYM